jgi:1-acyl-sn-glycerol-3-phosphate acyltransferase
MLYFLVRPIARYVLRYYYRHIDLTGLEHIPADAPVVLAANHPTAFIEPCILACFQPRTLWFLARGNLFKNAFYTALLKAIHILPVFRLEDGGYERLKDNFSTFAACHEALSQRKAIMILAEGRTKHEKALRPLYKGTARLALGALERDPSLPEVYVVPVGVNFTHADRVRHTVMIRFGQPILTSAFLPSYRKNEAAGIREFTRHLRDRLSPLVIQFPDRERASIGEARLVMDRNDHLTNLQYGVTHDGKQLDRELALAAATPKEAPQLTKYFNRLTQQKVPDAAVAGAVRLDRVKTLAEWMAALLGALMLLFQAPLWIIGEFIGAKMPKKIEFYSPVRFAVVAGGTFLLYPIVFFLLPLLWKVLFVLAILGTPWAIERVEHIHRWSQQRKIDRMVEAERNQLRAMRKEIMGR